MNFKYDKGLILIIVGILMSITISGMIIGVPLVLIGIYLEYKRSEKNRPFEEKLTKLEEIESEIFTKVETLDNIKSEISTMESELSIYQDELEIQRCGLYEPKYDFITAVLYKEKLDEIRKKQKKMIKDKTAAFTNIVWTVDGSKQKGQAMTNANIRQILRSFNNETEVIIHKVKHSNLDNSKKRIHKVYNQLNKLYERDKIQLSVDYLNLKLEEMYVAYEYNVKKQEEKELLRETREREREEKKLEQEKNKFNKENTKINKEIEELKFKLNKAAAEEKAKLESEIKELKKVLDKNNAEIKKLDKWKETPGAGYVYIISNIGSFGEDIYKIGVTRRDKPEERIKELSTASVPFRYDVHAFIFSKDAYSLESELHKRFDKQRVNKVNHRKEFFKITIDDVKQIVEENKGAVHSFVEKAKAEEYYDTLKIEKELESEISN